MRGSVIIIVTVTMNPAIDKTAEVDKLQAGALNRLTKMELDIGGKGINVSKTISALGGSTIACGFLAGGSGHMIENTLRKYNMKTDFVYVQGETRTNLKLIEKGGILTELNEQGPNITQEDMEMLSTKLEAYASPDTLFVIAGSIGPGVEPDAYRKLICRIKQKGAHVFLDADGVLFSEALEALPDIVKPNSYELSQYFGKQEEMQEAEMIEMGKQLLKKGIRTVCISRGGQGALFLHERKVIRVSGLKIKVHSSVGAGDAMVAAFSYGLDQKKGFEECIRLSVATSAGAVMTLGTKPPSIQVVEKLMKLVEIQYLE